MCIAFTPEESRYLDALDGKLTHAKDAVRGVVKGFHTGLLLWGEGGTSKSYTVIQELQRLRAKYVYHNTRLTARGLVDSLQRAPSDIHFIEDAETLMDDRKAFGVLRSALWSQSAKKPPEREVTWSVYQQEIRFVFTGGIIIISNTNLLDSVAEIRAIKTRINVLHLDVSNDEIRALMKRICRDGYVYGQDYMSPEECWQVGTFIIDRLSTLRRKLDLRLLMNGFKDYLQHKTRNSVCDWQVLLEGRMSERAHYVPRAEVKAEESQIAMEIHQTGLRLPDKMELWNKQTGLNQAAYYRALKRAEKREM